MKHWADGMPRRDLIDEVETLRGRLRDATFRESGLHAALRKETAEVERLRGEYMAGHVDGFRAGSTSGLADPAMPHE